MRTIKRFRTDDVRAEILCTLIGKSFLDINQDRHFRNKEATKANHNIERISDKFSVGCEVGKIYGDHSVEPLNQPAIRLPKLHFSKMAHHHITWLQYGHSFYVCVVVHVPFLGPQMTPISQIVATGWSFVEEQLGWVRMHNVEES
jgi:hypothetical protein